MEFLYKVIKSFTYAFNGIKYCLHERNMKVHVFSTFCVVLAGFYFEISKNQWLAILLCIALVISLEMVNTAVEEVCNLLRDKLGLSYNSTKIARDVAAGSVLFSTIISVIIGSLIFVPKFF